jgi:hypothetical protein
MAKLIESTVLLVACGFLMAGTVIAVGLLFLFCFGFVLARRLKAAGGFPAIRARSPGPICAHLCKASSAPLM